MRYDTPDCTQICIHSWNRLDGMINLHDKTIQHWFMLPKGALLVSKSYDIFKRFVLDIMGWLLFKKSIYQFQCFAKRLLFTNGVVQLSSAVHYKTIWPQKKQIYW